MPLALEDSGEGCGLESGGVGAWPWHRRAARPRLSLPSLSVISFCKMEATAGPASRRLVVRIKWKGVGKVLSRAPIRLQALRVWRLPGVCSRSGGVVVVTDTQALRGGDGPYRICKGPSAPFPALGLG